MDVASVMDEIAECLAGLPDLRQATGWPTGGVSPPAVVVGMPDEIEYDQTYGRGMDRMTIPVFLVVPKPQDRSARDFAAQYANGAGPASVRSAIAAWNWLTCDDVHVNRAEFAVIDVDNNSYLAGEYTCVVVGPGT